MYIIVEPHGSLIYGVYSRVNEYERTGIREDQADFTVH